VRKPEGICGRGLEVSKLQGFKVEVQSAVAPDLDEFRKMMREADKEESIAG
jgi:hypothetical protein